MKRSLPAVVCGMSLGLILAMSLGLAMGTLCSFSGFSHAVRPGSKEALFTRSLSTGTAWAEVASLIAVPAGAVILWRRTREAAIR